MCVFFASLALSNASRISALVVGSRWEAVEVVHVSSGTSPISIEKMRLCNTIVYDLHDLYSINKDIFEITIVFAYGESGEKNFCISMNRVQFQS